MWLSRKPIINERNSVFVLINVPAHLAATIAREGESPHLGSLELHPRYRAAVNETFIPRRLLPSNGDGFVLVMPTSWSVWLRTIKLTADYACRKDRERREGDARVFRKGRRESSASHRPMHPRWVMIGGDAPTQTDDLSGGSARAIARLIGRSTKLVRGVAFTRSPCSPGPPTTVDRNKRHVWQ